MFINKYFRREPSIRDQHVYSYFRRPFYSVQYLYLHTFISIQNIYYDINTNERTYDEKSKILLVQEYFKQKVVWDTKDKWHFNKTKKKYDVWDETVKCIEIDVKGTTVYGFP